MLVDQGFLKATLTLRASGLSCGEEHESSELRESREKVRMIPCRFSQCEAVYILSKCRLGVEHLQEHCNLMLIAYDLTR